MKKPLVYNDVTSTTLRTTHLFSFGATRAAECCRADRSLVLRIGQRAYPGQHFRQLNYVRLGDRCWQLRQRSRQHLWKRPSDSDTEVLHRERRHGGGASERRELFRPDRGPPVSRRAVRIRNPKLRAVTIRDSAAQRAPSYRLRSPCLASRREGLGYRRRNSVSI
jgi:hypothetical protein